MKILLVLLVSFLMLVTSDAEVLTVAHPSVEFSSDKTVVWSPLFQATWDAIKEKTGGQPAKIEPPNELMTKLDSFVFDAKSVMPENCWKVWAGPATQDFLTQVNREAAAITKEKDGPFRMEGGPQGSVAAFGLLDREIEYDRALYRSQKKAMNFVTSTGPVALQFFGVAGEQSAGFGETIRVLSYEPDKKSHAVELLCEKATESVIFYLPPAIQNFSTACDTIRAWKRDYKPGHELWGEIGDPGFHKNDSLRVPYVNLDVTAEFPELLTSLRYAKNGVVPWRIYRAEQVTRFDLHEKGAKVRVESSLEAQPFGEPPPPPPTIPRNFIYDRPFFIFLWRDKAEWPYFGAWIGDASALKPFW